MRFARKLHRNKFRTNLVAAILAQMERDPLFRDAMWAQSRLLHSQIFTARKVQKPADLSGWMEQLDTHSGERSWIPRDILGQWNSLQLLLRGCVDPKEIVSPSLQACMNAARRSRIDKSGIRDLSVKLFKNGTVTLGRAAKLAGMCHEEFMDLLGTMAIPVVTYSAEEVDDEVNAFLPKDLDVFPKP